MLTTYTKPQVMSSLEIAELTGKEHKNILRDIRNMLDGLETPQISFESGYLDKQNQERTLFKLPYRETMILVSGYDVKLRAKVVDRWMELEKVVQNKAMLPDALNIQFDALQRINSTNYSSINPNIIQMARDAAQNNLLIALGLESQQKPVSNLILGVVEIAKRYMNINIQKDGIAVGNSVTGVLKVGDIFTIAGCFAVHPNTKAVLPELQQFVVTADANSNGSGVATVSIAPGIVTSGAYQNVSAGPADTAVVTVAGASASTYTLGLAFAPDAYVLATAKLESSAASPENIVQEVDPETGIAVTFEKWRDARAGTDVNRIDVLFGWSALRPEIGCRVVAG